MASSVCLTQLLAAELQARNQQGQSFSGDDGIFDTHTLLSDAYPSMQCCRGGLALAARAAVASCKQTFVLILAVECFVCELLPTKIRNEVEQDKIWSTPTTLKIRSPVCVSVSCVTCAADSGAGADALR